MNVISLCFNLFLYSVIFIFCVIDFTYRDLKWPSVYSVVVNKDLISFDCVRLKC